MRYLMHLGGAGAPTPSAAELSACTGLAPVACPPPLTVVADQPARAILLGKSGIALGHLFPRHGPARPLDMLTYAEGEAIAASRGRGLSAVWGGYVMALVEADGVRVLRDPSGGLPCYFTRSDRGTLFASDIGLLVKAGLAAPAISWSGLGRHLYRAGLPTAETALDSVCELMPGFALDVGAADAAQVPIWSPWDHVEAIDASPAAVADHLGRTIRHCVRSWTAPFPRLLLSVSGGLDSSIVAASLGGRDTVCLTMYGSDPSGDERAYARALCDQLGLPLVERAYRVEDVDLDSALSAHLPRPIGRSQAIAYEAAHREVAAARGIDAFVTGNGGDNVFGYSQSAAAIVDRCRHEGLGMGVVRTMGDVCRQTGCGPVRAVRAALAIARAAVGYRWRANPRFLHPDWRAVMAGEALSHPWLDAPVAALPGKARHIAGLLFVQQHLEPGRSRQAPVLHPLLSQPIVEACLAIPSWQWRAEGMDRAVARRAFADLPEVIVRRRTKGGPDGFTARLIAHHREDIRARLLGGALAAHGLVDRPAIEASLAGGHVLSGEDRARILELVAAEAWIGAWAGRDFGAIMAGTGEWTRAARPNG